MDIRSLIAVAGETDSDISGYEITQPTTGISGKLVGDRLQIFLGGELIRQTSKQDVAEMFFSPFIDIWDFELEPLLEPVTVYKASASRDEQVPGFTTNEEEYASSFLVGDYGGANLVHFDLEPSSGRIDEAAILDGPQGYILIPPGAPDIVDLRNGEYIVLKPMLPS